MTISWIEKEYVRMLGNPYANLNFEDEEGEEFAQAGDVFEFEDGGPGTQRVMVVQIAKFKFALIELSNGNRWTDDFIETDSNGVPMSWIKQVLTYSYEDSETLVRTFKKIENLYRTQYNKEMEL